MSTIDLEPLQPARLNDIKEKHYSSTKVINTKEMSRDPSRDIVSVIKNNHYYKNANAISANPTPH